MISTLGVKKHNDDFEKKKAIGCRFLGFKEENFNHFTKILGGDSIWLKAT